MTACEKGLFIIISGPAGSGKGTVVKCLRELLPELRYSVSATTRAPRPGEVDGEHYHFVSREVFEGYIATGEVLEHTEYCGNYYGTLRSEAERITGDGYDVILEIEVDGACQVKSLCPGSVAVMLLPPDADSLYRRLTGRGTESAEIIERRMQRAKEELMLLDRYDYVVINGDGQAEQCAARMKSIIEAEHLKTSRMTALKTTFFGGTRGTEDTRPF